MHEQQLKNAMVMKGGLSWPVLPDKGRTLYYIKSSDGNNAVWAQDLDSGLSKPLTTTPQPSASVGYGGLSFTANDRDVIFCGNDKTLHRLNLKTGRQQPVSPVFSGLSAPALSACGNFVVYTAEYAGRCNVCISALDGEDFPLRLSQNPWFAINPAVSSDGQWITWIEWKKGSMPWFESQIQLIRLTTPLQELKKVTEVRVSEQKTIACPGVAHSSPRFCPKGKNIAYISDASGTASLHYAPCTAPDTAMVIPTPGGELGGPDWVSGLSALSWHHSGQKIIALQNRSCSHHLIEISLKGDIREIETGCSSIGNFFLSGDQLFLAGSAPDAPDALWEQSLTDGKKMKRAEALPGIIFPDSLGEGPRVVRWNNGKGYEIEGIFYPAVRKGPSPLLVKIHGGPSSQKKLDWDPESRLFASRGLGTLLVNYRGSTGYGREFMEALKGKWGLADIEDARTGAEYLVDNGYALREQIAIMGGSAGGYSVLQALCHQSDFWAAGISLYGISHLFDLEETCHRFEQNYTQSLVGILPESAELWSRRSPLNHAANIRAPLLLFHGKQDKAVPYQQSELIHSAVCKQGGACEMILYEDEGHGFRKSANILNTSEKILSFFNKYVIHRQPR